MGEDFESHFAFLEEGFDLFRFSIERSLICDFVVFAARSLLELVLIGVLVVHCCLDCSIDNCRHRILLWLWLCLWLLLWLICHWMIERWLCYWFLFRCKGLCFAFCWGVYLFFFWTVIVWLVLGSWSMNRSPVVWGWPFVNGMKRLLPFELLPNKFDVIATSRNLFKK